MIMQDIVKISKNTLIAKIKEIWIKVMYLNLKLDYRFRNYHTLTYFDS